VTYSPALPEKASNTAHQIADVKPSTREMRVLAGRKVRTLSAHAVGPGPPLRVTGVVRICFSPNSVEEDIYHCIMYEVGWCILRAHVT
jgi:hypothetical protein